MVHNIIARHFSSARGNVDALVEVHHSLVPCAPTNQPRIWCTITSTQPIHVSYALLETLSKFFLSHVLISWSWNCSKPRAFIFVLIWMTWTHQYLFYCTNQPTVLNPYIQVMQFILDTISKIILPHAISSWSWNFSKPRAFIFVLIWITWTHSYL